MASVDVIELGSSDDEAEPAPKKKKLTENVNAMVNIPSKLPDVTIVPTKSKLSSSLRAKGIMKKPITVIKSNFDPNPTISKLKQNSGTSRASINIRNFGNSIKTVQTLQNKFSVNPLSIAKNLNQSQIIVKKVPLSKRHRNTTEIQGKKILNNLPPQITIKPLPTAEVTIRPLQKAGASGLKRKVQLVAPKKKQSKQLLTVEIDDEDVTENDKTGSPQWYLRPEEHTKSNEVKGEDKDVLHNVEPSMEEENNREPDTTKFVEITIEDTPVKSVQPRHPDIGKELTITIEDSPIKPALENIKDVESDIELSEVSEGKCPQSKKKLDFPKKPKQIEESQVVEIEIDLKESNNIEVSKEKNKFDSTKDNSNVEILESAKQKTQVENDILLKKEINTEIQSKDNITDVDNEFHPTYQKFICMCFQLEDSEDMKKIVEKKIKSYYRQCPKDYVESEEFIDMVSSKIASMKASPEKMYLFIKDIVDELNLQRKMTKKTKKDDKEVEEESSDIKYEDTKYDTKKRRQIRKLEKTIKKLHRAIQKLEEQEVDFDDDEDSVYLLTERYKERMVRVHAKFCQLTNTKMPSEPRIHIEARHGRPTGPAKRLEKWINRKVPIGTPLPFPDFHDVLRCVRDANEEDKLGWNDIDITEEARDLFTRCGKKLQRRRQENEWRIAASRIPVDIEPAEESIELKRKLDENKIVAAKKEAELLNKYVDRQDLLKLEAEEIGDKEAEESPVESEEDEEVVDDNSLESKEKRKQRLKRLIEDKSKKEENKENDINKGHEEKTNKVYTKDDLDEGITEKIAEETQSDIVNEAKSKESKTDDENIMDAESVIDQKQNDNSDSDYKVESDLDEFNLLQKLYSENEANTSALETSDSDTPIAISDTLDSDSETETCAKSCDIISIENSSYSENESTMDGLSKDNDAISSNKANVEKLVNSNVEIEYCSAGIKENSKEIASTEIIIEENILLASSDEEDGEKIQKFSIEDTCINLKDDSLSISETVVDGVINEKEIVSSDENTMQENNNHVEIVDRDLETEQNDCAIHNIEHEHLEHVHMNCKEIIEKSSNGEDATSSENNLPKDVVDIRSTSDVTSVESIDLLTDNDKDKGSCDSNESMDVDEFNKQNLLL